MAILSCHVSIKLPPKISDGQDIAFPEGRLPSHLPEVLQRVCPLEQHVLEYPSRYHRVEPIQPHLLYTGLDCVRRPSHRPSRRDGEQRAASSARPRGIPAGPWNRVETAPP